MDQVLPLSTQSATQITYITSTGLEKILVLVGVMTILLLASFGLITIIWLAVRSGFSKNKSLNKNLLK